MLFLIVFFVFFFFKQKTAYEILYVTGVQTCALPICASAAPARLRRPRRRAGGARSRLPRQPRRPRGDGLRTRRVGRREDGARAALHRSRSEERRVGKECRSRWWRDHAEQK